MADYIAWDVANASRQIEHVLAAYPELAEDHDLRADTLEGETDLTRLMSRLVRMRQEKVASVDGLANYIDDLSQRKARTTRAAEGIKSLMLMLLSSADLQKLVLDEATVSITKPRETVVVLDAEALPQGTFTTVRQPDKKAIKAMIDAGDDVPGAALETGDVGLTVRVK